jgi:hypothetical protein
MKRGSNSKKSKSITYVCSCNSRKICGTKSEIFFENLEDSNSNSPIFKKIYSRGKKKKKVKRFNVDACHFRIRFKWHKSGKYIHFVKESYSPHNHPPCENKSVKVRKSFYLFYLKLIKGIFFNLSQMFKGTTKIN